MARQVYALIAGAGRRRGRVSGPTHYVGALGHVPKLTGFLLGRASCRRSSPWGRRSSPGLGSGHDDRVGFSELGRQRPPRVKRLLGRRRTRQRRCQTPTPTRRRDLSTRALSHGHRTPIPSLRRPGDSATLRTRRPGILRAPRMGPAPGSGHRQRPLPLVVQPGAARRNGGRLARAAPDALDHRPHLASLIVGLNDTLRSAWDPAAVRTELCTPQASSPDKARSS